MSTTVYENDSVIDQIWLLKSRVAVCLSDKVYFSTPGHKQQPQALPYIPLSPFLVLQYTQQQLPGHILALYSLVSTLQDSSQPQVFSLG